MENQELLQAMFEEATLGILVVNSDGEIQNANPFSEKLFGYSKGELHGQKVEMLLPEAFRTVHVLYRENYHQHPSPRPMGAGLELSGQRKDGSEFPVEISLSFTNVKNEKLAIAYINDISNKKNIKTDLQIKNTAISEGAMPIAFTDLEGNITEVNDAFSKMWGYSNQSELIGLNNQQLSSTKAEINEINNSIRSHGRWTGEATAMKKDGSFFDVFISSNLIANKQGIAIGMVASFIDITQLHETESINRDISRIVEESLNEIFIFDAKNLKFIQVNKGARQNLGYSIDELKQLTPVDIKPLFSEKRFDDFIQPLLNGKTQKLQFETIHERKDKTTYPVYIHLEYSTLGNKPIFVATILDISKLKEAEEKLQNLNLDLEEKVMERTQELKENQAKLEVSLEKEKGLGLLKSRFVSMASHEFRTPLTSILSSANLIGRYEEKEQNDKRMKHVNRIASSVKNLTSILNDFLSLEKLESDKLNFEPVLLDFEEFVESILDEINLIAIDNQNIIFHHSGNKEVQIDEHLVKNIMINLLSNAVKYSPKGKDVELITKNENGLLEILVKDKGIGIPKADHEHMFTRFFRATNVTAIQGTGLGLTIVKRYLDLMGGEIDFESEQYEGSTFRVKIPQGE